MSSGNATPTASPAASRPPAALAARPTTVGPAVQPRSPARAMRANIAVPPPGSAATAVLQVPGQKMPTEKPHSAQPMSASTGFALAAAVSYLLSGYYGLYSSQKIVYSKLRAELVNINAK